MTTKCIASLFLPDGHGSMHLWANQPNKPGIASGITVKIENEESPREALLRKLRSFSILDPKHLDEAYLQKLIPEEVHHEYTFIEDGQSIKNFCFYVTVAIAPEKFFHPKFKSQLVGLSLIKLHWETNPKSVFHFGTSNLHIPIASVEAIKEYTKWFRVNTKKDPNPKKIVKETYKEVVES